MDTQNVPPDDNILSRLKNPLLSNRKSEEKHDRQCVSLPVLYDKNETCHFDPGRGMECMQLNTQLGTYQYHVVDQTKSLQELQDEVGALLEFRDLVIETFPDLKSKMASLSTSNVVASSPSPLNSRREWESGVRIRKKMNHQHDTSDVHTLTRSRSNSNSGKKEPKSGEGNNGSAIQDSGFSTETNSSKETHSATSTSGTATNVMIGTSSSSGFQRTSSHEVEDDLWNLLDVIHRKSTRLRDEMEHLKSLEQKKNSSIQDYQHNHSIDKFNLRDLFQLELNKINNEDMNVLRKERDHLLNRLAEMEAESVAGKIRTNRMQSEVNALHLVKRNLEGQLGTVISQNLDLNTRLHDVDHNDIPINSTEPSKTRQCSIMAVRKLSSPDTSSYHLNVISNRLFNNVSVNKKMCPEIIVNPTALSILKTNNVVSNENFILGRLDGLVSSPNRCNKVRMTDSRKIAAILLETNTVELQRHLLTITIQNQALTQKLEQATKSKIYLIKKLNKAKEGIDDLKFQLEERNIELEGTKAQLRVMASKSSKTIPSELFVSTTIGSQVSTPSMKAMTPLILDDINSSSSTESAKHDHIAREGANNRTMSKNRPSKIPLAGAKMNFSPKPPTGRNSVGSRSPSGPSSNKSLNKISSSLNNRFEMTTSTTKSSNTNTITYQRPESALSVRKDVSISSSYVRNNTSSIPVSTQKSPTVSYANKLSPVLKPKRESFSSKMRNMDSLSRLHIHTSPTHSSISTPTTTTNGSTTNISPIHTLHDNNNSSYKLRERKQINSQSVTTTPIRRMAHTSFGSKGIDLSAEPVEKVQTNLRKIWNMLKI